MFCCSCLADADAGEPLTLSVSLELLVSVAFCSSRKEVYSLGLELFLASASVLEIGTGQLVLFTPATRLVLRLGREAFDLSASRSAVLPSRSPSEG